MIFLGPLFPKEQEEEILKKTRSGISNAANQFQWKLIDGLTAQLGRNMHVVNVLPVGTYPRHYRELLLRNRKWKIGDADCCEIGCLNLPLLKQLMRTVRLRRYLKNIDPRESILICTAYLPFLWAAHFLPASVQVTAIITDLPEYYDMHQVSVMRELLRKLHTRLVYRYMSRVDRFVLLTEQMALPLKVGRRPYIVMEGICSSAAQPQVQPTHRHPGKVLMYTGRLNRRYGLADLLEAFSGMDMAGLQLWICGSGEMEDEVRAAAQSDRRIRFFGFQPHSEVIKLQKQASLLVNPRTSQGEYTKYSFPSKTIEYMASGVPVVMYKLPGIPDEYDPYLIYVSGTGPDALRDTLYWALKMPPADLERLGAEASRFVCTRKNAEKQAERILELMRGGSDCG